MSICSYQEVNYTIVITDDSEGVNLVAQYGPIQHSGPGILEHDIRSSKLKRGQEYFLRATAVTMVGDPSYMLYPFSKLKCACMYIWVHEHA